MSRRGVGLGENPVLYDYKVGTNNTPNMTCDPRTTGLGQSCGGGYAKKGTPTTSASEAIMNNRFRLSSGNLNVDPSLNQSPANFSAVPVPSIANRQANMLMQNRSDTSTLKLRETNAGSTRALNIATVGVAKQGFGKSRSFNVPTRMLSAETQRSKQQAASDVANPQRKSYASRALSS
jgi:hypothetical protein